MVSELQTHLEQRGIQTIWEGVVKGAWVGRRGGEEGAVANLPQIVRLADLGREWQTAVEDEGRSHGRKVGKEGEQKMLEMGGWGAEDSVLLTTRPN